MHLEGLVRKGLDGAMALVFVTSSVTAVEAQNWPNWRGPTRDGVSADSVPVEWDTEKNVSWKLPMPEWTGSTPVIWDNFIFLNVAVDEESIELWCLKMQCCVELSWELS